MIEVCEETYHLWTRCDIRFRFTCERYGLTQARKEIVTSVGSPTETKSDWSEFIFKPVPCITKRMKRNVQCIQHENSNRGRYFYFFNGTAILRGHPNHAKVFPFWQCKGSTFISHYFKTLSIIPSPGIEPATSRSGVKRSTDRANPIHTRGAAVGLEGLVFLFTLHQRVSQEPYPICDNSLLRSACCSSCSVAPLQKLHRNHRSFICVNRSQGAQKLSVIV